MSDLELNTITPKADHALLAESRRRAPQNPKEDPKQRRLMVGSLCLLLLALGIVLWHDRDFWFPDTPEAESDQPVESSPAAKVASAQPSAANRQASHSRKAETPGRRSQSPSRTALAPPPVAISARTVLPPLEVEVVAGDTHRTIRPGSSSVRVDLQPGAPPQPITEAQSPATPRPPPT